MPPAAAAASAGIGTMGGAAGMSGMEIPPAYIPPRPGRLPNERPIVKLSVCLIDTYKEINRVRMRIRALMRLVIVHVAIVVLDSVEVGLSRILDCSTT